MGPHHQDRSGPNDPLPRAAWIGAYLDGELGPEDLARVEAWLTESATARAEVEAQRRLRDFLAAGPAPDPSPAAWDQTLAGIASGLRGRHPSGSRSWKYGQSLAWLIAAAAVVAGVWIGAGHFSGNRPQPAGEVFEVASESDVVIDDMDPADALLIVIGQVPTNLPEEVLAQLPLEVAEDSEIAVITMDGDDTGMLVVGVPPITGPFEPALLGEVRVDHIATGEGPRPYMHDQIGGMPMIMMRQKTVRRD